MPTLPLRERRLILRDNQPIPSLKRQIILEELLLDKEHAREPTSPLPYRKIIKQRIRPNQTLLHHLYEGKGHFNMTCPMCLTVNELAVVLTWFSNKYRLNLTAIPKYKSAQKYLYLKITNTTNSTTRVFTDNMIRLIGKPLLSHIKHSEINKETSFYLGDDQIHYHRPTTRTDHERLTSQTKERQEQKDALRRIKEIKRRPHIVIDEYPDQIPATHMPRQTLQTYENKERLLSELSAITTMLYHIPYNMSPERILNAIGRRNFNRQ